MTTIVDALDRVARACSVTPPSNWITDTSDTVAEIRDDILPETIDDLTKRVDWSSPTGKQTTISGDGSEDYDLPADFIRLKRDEFAVYETANVRRIGTPVQSDGAWTHIKQIGTGAGNRFFRTKGYPGSYQISLYPNPASGESVTVSYVSSVWMADSGGTKGSDFTAITDVLLFPRRLIETGCIWRWLQRRGFDFQIPHMQYEAQIATEANATNQHRVIDIGGPRSVSAFDIPVPDYIPSS